MSNSKAESDTLWQTFPRTAITQLDAAWSLFEPYYNELISRSLDSNSLEAWLIDWSRLSELRSEIDTRLAIAKDLDTEDAAAKQKYLTFQEDVEIPAENKEQALRQKLLNSKLEPQNFALPLRKMRVKAELFREENLALELKEEEASIAYSQILGTQTVLWKGVETTISELEQEFLSPDRTHREHAWKIAERRQLADCGQITKLWQTLLTLRCTIAQNAGEPDYRSFRWKELQRLDYSPDHCKQFCHAILTEIVPAATRIYEAHREILGVETLRPWDLMDGWYSRPTDPPGSAPLRPFAGGNELAEKTQSIFQQLEPDFGAYVKTMRDEGLLDLENKKGKSPGGYCTNLDVARRPFIFMNAVGMHEDVQTSLHEAGHAFHAFETYHLPHPAQRDAPLEFCEVASMTMEALAAPYLEKSRGGFYEPADAARARLEALERTILFWPFMAVVDSFQRWVYENPAAARDGDACDLAWDTLWQNYIPGVDYSGFEQFRASGWQRKHHIFKWPFYYTEYGMAQMCAQQIWKRSLSDPTAALRDYRAALRLGATVPLPELYTRSGGKFSFDAATLRETAVFAEQQIEKLREAAR